MEHKEGIEISHNPLCLQPPQKAAIDVVCPSSFSCFATLCFSFLIICWLEEASGILISTPEPLVPDKRCSGYRILCFIFHGALGCRPIFYRPTVVPEALYLCGLVN